MKCPVCQKVHPHRDWSPTLCSHGALVVYTSALCPICLEEVKPAIALPCGHVMCKLDFGKMGGVLQATSPGSATSRTHQPLDRYRIPDLESEDAVREGQISTVAEEGWDLGTVASGVLDMPGLHHFVSEDESETAETGSRSSDTTNEEYESSFDLGSNSEPTDEEDEYMEMIDPRENLHREHETRERLAEATPRPIYSRRRRNRLRGGAWLLVPKEGTDRISTLVYIVGNCSYVMGEYSRTSSIVLDGRASASVLVLSPQKPNTDEKKNWVFHHVNLERSILKYRALHPKQAVSDGNSGVWTLTRQRHEVQLIFSNSQFQDGRRIIKVPTFSYMITENSGAVWIHVRYSNRSSSRITLRPGLWHISTRRKEFVMDIPIDAKCVSDWQGGVWVFYRNEVHAALHKLTRVSNDKSIGFRKDIEVNSNAAKLVGDGANGVYLHDMTLGRWKLYHISGQHGSKEICCCSRDAKIVPDGLSGVWIIQRRSRVDASRLLRHVNENGQVIEEAKLPVGSMLSELSSHHYRRTHLS